MCKAAGIARLVINGSFVTDSLEPNDVDCVLLQGPAYRASSQVAQELGKGLPFLELKVVEQDDFDYLTSVMFSSDRDFVPKGMVEVPLDD